MNKEKYRYHIKQWSGLRNYFCSAEEKKKKPNVSG